MLLNYRVNTNEFIIGNNFLFQCELIQRSNPLGLSLANFSSYEVIKPKLSTKFCLQIAESLISLEIKCGL